MDSDNAPAASTPAAPDPEAEHTGAVDTAERSSGWFGPAPASLSVGLAVLICGALGLLSSITLTLERFHLFTDPNYRPSCSINPIISCGSVMVTKQGALFGFPNPIIGVAAFPVIVVTGVLVTARISLPRWYWLSQALATLLGFVFINWLAFECIYRIHALCPYCMVVWTITPLIVVLSLGRVLDTSRIAREIRGWLWVLLPVWYVAVIVAIGVEFWDYWKTLF